MTTSETLELRQRAGFTTPVQPIERGKPWTVFNDRGRVELMMNTDEALEALVFGYEFRGERLLAKDVGVFPFINAIQILLLQGVLWEPGGRKWSTLCRLSEMGGSSVGELVAA